MDWKDTLLPGASRTPLPWDGSLAPGWVLDTYGVPTERNDWVMGPNGVPVISGSSEAQPGAGPGPVSPPSPGFQPVDPGQYGANPYFAGRGAGVSSLLGAINADLVPGGLRSDQGPASLLALLDAPEGQSKSLAADQLAALRKALGRMQFQIPS